MNEIDKQNSNKPPTTSLLQMSQPHSSPQGATAFDLGAFVQDLREKKASSENRDETNKLSDNTKRYTSIQKQVIDSFIRSLENGESTQYRILHATYARIDF